MSDMNITGSVNSHMQHAEDVIYNSGKQGIEFILRTLYSLYDGLKGSTEKSDIVTSLKVDGAPAAFVASSFNGKGPFVSTKGIFAANPKIASTPEEVDALYGKSPDLANKLKILLSLITKLGIPANEIWQGDFLYSKDTLKKANLDGESCIVFHPNTIVYAVPEKSALADKILNSQIGIIWHTRYTGSDFTTLKASFNAKVDELNDIPEVFQTDPYIRSFAGKVTLTDEENKYVLSTLQAITDVAEDLRHEPVLDLISKNEELNLLINTFENSTIKSQNKQLGGNPLDYVKEFISWVSARYDAEIESKKSAKGKEAATQKKEKVLSYLNNNIDGLVKVITFQQMILSVKSVFLKKLNSFGSFKTFLNIVDKGYVPTGQEGFAISDINGNVIKLVDRLNFSFANFSKDVIKGWVKECIFNNVQKRLNEEVAVNDILPLFTKDKRFTVRSVTGKDKNKGTITVVDNESNREDALIKTVSNLKNLPLNNIRRGRREIYVDDVSIIFKDKSKAEGNKGNKFENDVLKNIKTKKLSDPTVQNLEKVLMSTFGKSINDIVEIKDTGHLNTRRPLVRQALMKGYILVLPKDTTDFKDGDAISWALADGIIKFKDGTELPLSMKSGSKVSLINAGLGRSVEESKQTIAYICKALSPDINIKKVLKGFLSYSAAYKNKYMLEDTSLERKPSIRQLKADSERQSISIDPSVFRRLITSATGFNYIMIHDTHVEWIDEAQVKKMSKIVSATVRYPSKTNGRFEVTFESAGMNGVVVIRDTNADGREDKLLIEYNSKGIK